MYNLHMSAVPGTQAIIETRTFAAPRELVFKALVDRELIPLWWGPAYLTTMIDQLDARPGGMWRFVQHDPDGNEYAFHGVFHTVTAPGRIVQTFEWEGMSDHVLMETMTLEEQDGRTTLTTNSVFQSVADRDGMLASGMEDGDAESTERLGTLLAKMTK
jgi:uncharacterized protein YndB with AHSA1/START domain